MDCRRLDVTLNYDTVDVREVFREEFLSLCSFDWFTDTEEANGFFSVLLLVLVGVLLT